MESKHHTLGGHAKRIGIKCVIRARLLMLAAVMALLAAQATSAAETQIPEQAKAIHVRLIAALKPAVREWVSQEAKKVSKDPKTSEAAIKADIQSRFAGQSLAGADVEALAFIVLMEASQDAQNDLKSIMDGVKSANERKAALRQAPNNLKQQDAAIKVVGQPDVRPATTNLQARTGAVVAGKNAPISAAGQPANLNSMGDMSQEQQLLLQRAMDQRSQLEAMISNVMKAVSDSQSNIVSNLK
jgi:hypothetical protein